MWDTEILKIHRHGFILLSFYRLDGKWIIQQKDLFSQHGMTWTQRLFLLLCDWRGFPAEMHRGAPRQVTAHVSAPCHLARPLLGLCPFLEEASAKHQLQTYFFFLKSGHMIPKSGAKEVTKSCSWIGHSLTENKPLLCFSHSFCSCGDNLL